MLSILKAIDIDLDPEQMLRLLTQHIQKTEDTYDDLIKMSKKWPYFASSEPAQKTDISLQPYKAAFDTLKLLLNPTDDNFQELIQYKKEVHRAKEDLNTALQSKALIGPQVCLEKAKILKDLLKRQREAENRYIEIMTHKWKTAMDTFREDLLNKNKIPQNLIDALSKKPEPKTEPKPETETPKTDA